MTSLGSFQLPDLFRVTQKLKHINEDVIQTPLEHWLAWAISHPCRKPIPVWLPSWWRNFSNVQSKPSLMQLCSVPLWTAISSQGAETSTSPSALCSFLRMGSKEAASELCFLQTTQPKWTSSPFTSFLALLWTLLSTLTPFLCCGAHNCTQYSRSCCSNAKSSGRITFFDLQTMMCLMHTSSWYSWLGIF